jgi:hypothetical protein
MRFRKRPSIVVVLVAGILLFVFAVFSVPLLVSSGLRLWIWWKARQEHLSVKLDKIEAPLLRPVVIRGLRLEGAHEAGFRVEAQAGRISAGLNLKAIALRTGERAIRNISVDGLRMEIHRRTSAEPPLSESGWRTLQKLLPGSFDCQQLNVRIETGGAVALLRNASLSGNEIEAGHFATDQVLVMSPWFRQSFSQLRGATKWEENRLTLAGLSLAPGLDLPSITGDLSHLAEQNVGLNLDVEVFGGKVRAKISREWRANAKTWNVVGSAGDISLAQTAEALGFAQSISGMLHACNFTFRGNLLDPARASGWLWMELTAPAWHERAADLVMLGATLADREVHLQQLYVKQGPNDLTLSGDASLPATWSDWPNARLRADVSAAIVDLREFAGLFGANRDQFGGALTVEGTIHARDRDIRGHFSATGSALSLFQKPVDLLNATAKLDGTHVVIERFELGEAGDFLRAAGKIDIWHPQDSHGTIDLSLRDLSNYFSAAPAASALTGRLTVDGSNALIESLQFDNGALAIDFGGTLDFANLHNIGITLMPTSPLFDLGWMADSDCAGAFHLFPPHGPEKILPQIQRIDVGGDLLSDTWRIGLRHDIGPDRDWPICPGGNGHALNVAVAGAEMTEFAWSALRSFRSGQSQTLSLSSDQP